VQPFAVYLLFKLHIHNIVAKVDLIHASFHGYLLDLVTGNRKRVTKDVKVFYLKLGLKVYTNVII
jgi:hypothetical protein